MRFFTSVHLLLLTYIIAIIIFWGLSLQRQNEHIYSQQVTILKAQVDSLKEPVRYTNELASLKHKQAMRTSQYIGEGTTFLIVILIGAVVVYTSFMRRIRLSKQQNNFMLAVTHELKSPIAAMKLNLQTLERHQLDEEKKQQLLQRCIKESNRLNDLCNNMLFASQLEGRQYKAVREEFDLSALADYVAGDYSGRYPRKFIREIEPECKMTGDRVMLQMAINNILENAVKYTPEDKPITVRLSTRDNNAILQIADQGVGIADGEKKKIFNKFYRVGNEESRKSKGTGLGLYLTNKIILQHKGRITVKNNTPTGSIFEICLPL